MNNQKLNYGDIVLLKFYRGIVPFKVISSKGVGFLAEVDSGFNGFSDLEFSKDSDENQRYEELIDFCNNIAMPLEVVNIISNTHQLGLREYLAYIIEDTGAEGWDRTTSNKYKNSVEWVKHQKARNENYNY